MRVRALLFALLLSVAPAAAQESPDSPVQAGITLLDTWIQTQMEYRRSARAGDRHRSRSGTGVGEGLRPRLAGSPGADERGLHLPDRLPLEALHRDHGDASPRRRKTPPRRSGHRGILPWFDIRNRHPEARPVTVRHLLTHTAGLPRESIHPAWTDFEFPEVEALRETVSDQETTYATETKWKYSNLGFTLAGMVAEDATGGYFADLVTDGILRPLGMDSTSVGQVPADQRDRLATGYGRRMPDGPREVFPFVDARSFDPATGLSSTVPDMLRFLSWQMRVRDRRSEEVLASNTLLEMQRVHWLQSSWDSGWGLGFSVRHTEDRDLIGHGGGYPGYRTQTQLSPEEKIGVVVFTNGGDGDPGRYLNKAFEWVAPALAASRAEKEKPAVWSSDWDIYLGTYRRRSGETAVLRQENDLVILSPLSEDPNGSKGVLRPTDTPHVFRLESDGFGAHGELVRFEVNDAGEVTRIFVGVNYSRRLR